MSGTVSNPRDLLVLLLGEVLYVERRLAGSVLEQLLEACSEPALGEALNDHLTETRTHVERVETAFRRIGVAPSANLAASFESAVSQHDKLVGSIIRPEDADLFHAVTALRTEHWEIASYTSLLEFGEGIGYREELFDLRANLHEEEHVQDTLLTLISQLSAPRDN